MKAIDDVIEQAIREQWAVGADRTIMTIMVQQAVRAAIVGATVSVDMSTGDNDVGARVFGRIYSGQLEGDGSLTLFAEFVEDTRSGEPESTVAVVTVDADGRLTSESTVTVGEWTWPVPERTEGAGIAAPARIGAALAQRNWKMAGEASEPQWSPARWEHVIEVRVEPIETRED